MTRIAFEQLVVRVTPTLLKVACKQLGPDRADDAVQAALLEAWKYSRHVCRAKHPEAWLVRVLQRSIKRSFRSQKIHTIDTPNKDRLIDSHPSPAKGIDEHMADKELVALAMDGLTRQERQIVVSVSVEGYSFCDTAKRLRLWRHCSKRVQTIMVSRLYHRAVQTMRVKLTMQNLGSRQLG